MQHWLKLVFILPFIACVACNEKGTISDCGLTKNAGNWTVSGSCRIQEYKNIIDDRYACSWSQASPNTSTDHWSTSFIADDPEAPVNRSGHCIFITRSLPPEEGVYTYFLHYQPAHDERHMVGNITISVPRTPKTQTNCPQYVMEGDTLTCDCTTTDPGSPPSVLQWSGFTSHQLTVHNVTRAMDGAVYNCTQTWNTSIMGFENYKMRVQYVTIMVNSSFGRNETKTLILTCVVTNADSEPDYTWTGIACDNGNHSNTCSFVARVPEDNGKVVSCNAASIGSQNYTLNLTYPPSPPVITGYNTSHVLTAGDSVSLTCTVSGGNPPVNNITFYCRRRDTNVTGEFNPTTSSSTLTMERLEVSDNGTECVCTAKWQPDPSLHLGASLSLTVSDKTPRSSKSYIGAFVGGGVVAVVVVVAVAAGVLLYRKYGRDLYDRPQPRQQEPDHYTGLALYEDIRGSKRDQTVDVTGSEYENTGMNTSRPACITTEVKGDTDDEKPGHGLVDDPSLSGAYERLQVNIQESNNYTELTLKSIQK